LVVAKIVDHDDDEIGPRIGPRARGGRDSRRGQRARAAAGREELPTAQ
jgi:hypothetical protein